MVKQTKRVFDKDFKINAVKLILNKDKKVSELSRELKVNSSILHTWKNQYLQASGESFQGKLRLEQMMLYKSSYTLV
jgi:transposase